MLRHGLPVLAAAVLSVFSAPVLAEDPRPAPSPTPKPEPKLETVYVEVTGAEGAEAKVAAVAKAVGGVEGVRAFSWTVDGVEAKVVREVGRAADAALLAAARSAGATTAGVVPVAVTRFAFEKKLHCGGCVGAVTKALRAVKGVKESTVSADMTHVTAVYDTRVVKPADLEAALAAAKKPAKAVAR
jgi:copper chaperone CopZ